jgi:hypothetical protein
VLQHPGPRACARRCHLSAESAAASGQEFRPENLANVLPRRAAAILPEARLTNRNRTAGERR